MDRKVIPSFNFTQAFGINYIYTYIERERERQSRSKTNVPAVARL